MIASPIGKEREHLSLRGKQANGLVTQQRVLRAAVAQFLEKGCTGTTTADITGAADPVFLYAVETALSLSIATVIRKNASVAFEMDCQNALQHGETACTHSYYYASVLGEGKAEILEGDEKCCTP